MKIKLISKISGGQDGAIYGDELFRFNTKGDCTVYNISDVISKKDGEVQPIAAFKLDRTETLAPHSNAVCFGCEFY